MEFTVNKADLVRELSLRLRGQKEVAQLKKKRRKRGAPAKDNAGALSELDEGDDEDDEDEDEADDDDDGDDDDDDDLFEEADEPENSKRYMAASDLDGASSAASGSQADSAIVIPDSDSEESW